MLKRQGEPIQKANPKLDVLIDILQKQLTPLQRISEENSGPDRWPVGLILGAPRSGTTLFLQWLGNLGCFSYPSNFLNRFAYAPHIGALIQKMIFDPEYDFAGEFSDLNSTINFSSNLGKSRGALATSEFQHFFRNYLGHYDAMYMDDQTIDGTDFYGLERGLASIAQAFCKPFVTKALMLQFNIVQSVQHLKTAIFLFVERDPMMTMQSIFLARKTYYGSHDIWWSCKPREYGWLKERDCYQQIAGQVFFTNRSIRSELAKIPTHRSLFIKYEDFCQFPAQYFDQLRSIFSANGYEIKDPYLGPEAFDAQMGIKIQKSAFIRLQEAYDQISAEYDFNRGSE